MQIDKLKYFLEVARTGSINQAAQNLHISAQALNQFVHLMERELDTKLFDGSRKGSKLTEQGEIVRTVAESVMQIWGRMKYELSAQQSVCDVVRIGCVPYYEWLYYEVYAHIKTVYPNVKLQLQIVDSETAIALLAADELDMIFASFHKEQVAHVLQANAGFEYLYMQESIFGALMSKQSTLAKKESIDWADLQDEALVFHKQWEHGGNMLEQYVRAQGCHNFVYMYSESSIHKALEENMVCMIVPVNSPTIEVTKQKTKFVKMNGDLCFSHGILYQRISCNNRVISEIVEYAKRYCK